MMSIWPVRIAVKRTDESGIGRYTTSSRCGSPASQYPSNRLSVRWSSFTHSTKRKGPVPTGLRAKSSLYFSTAARETIIPARSVNTDNRGTDGAGKRHLDREGIDDLDVLDRSDLASPRRGQLGIAHAIEIPLHDLGVELGAIVEFHAAAQLEDVHEAAALDLPRLRELRHD